MARVEITKHAWRRIYERFPTAETKGLGNKLSKAIDEAPGGPLSYVGRSFHSGVPVRVFEGDIMGVGNVHFLFKHHGGKKMVLLTTYAP